MTNESTTHFLSFVLSSTSQGVVNNHIPLDGTSVGKLVVSKTASKATAEIGDTVRYSISVRNSGNGVIPIGVLVDRLPIGFKLMASTATWNTNGTYSTVTPTINANALEFISPGLIPGSTATLSYLVRIGIGSDRGDGVNHAYLKAGNTQSTEATATVKVYGGVFGNDACIVGKVFGDCNKNGVQDLAEKGIPSVRLYLETGVSVTTDKDGKFSYCGLAPRTHAIKLDSSTLPPNSGAIITSNRNLGDPNSLILDMKNGDLFRADFAIDSCGTKSTSTMSEYSIEANSSASNQESK
jgi:uncharacterized repeat protein (TIGR01451 family)